MVFQKSLALEDLLAGLEDQKPKSIGFEQPHCYERVLKFHDRENAEIALHKLVALLPEDKKADIKIFEAKGFEDGEAHFRLSVGSLLLITLKKSMKASLNDANSRLVSESGLVATLEARSRTIGGPPRRTSDDVLHPEKSVNTFMAPLGGLEHVFDLCERLVHAGQKAGGNKHKYFASSSSYGIRFDSQQDADNAKRIFEVLIPQNASMVIDRDIVNHKTHYWLKVPSEQADRVLSEAKSLSAACSNVATMFKEGNLEKAMNERADLGALIEGMGLGGSHVAEQMIRDSLQPKVPAR